MIAFVQSNRNGLRRDAGAYTVMKIDPTTEQTNRISRMAMVRFAGRLLLLGAALIVPQDKAWSHAHLAGATPSPGSTITAAPATLTLRFTEGVEPAFCKVSLKGPTGAVIQLAPPRPADGNAKALVVAVPTLMPGSYTVEWHATSVDTHETDGSYQFTISSP
jgi:copper resistance protein C